MHPCYATTEPTMSLRPRYSLLTLLVLTALVAGGVKLWYGPHHVTEPTKLGEEEEYTYTNDWQGNRVIQGTKIVRSYALNRELQQARSRSTDMGIACGISVGSTQSPCIYSRL